MNSISIIIPVYNVEKYLDECIQSVIAQTFQDWELLLVDDGSIDNSAQICDEYTQQDSRISVIHKTNKGLSSARNTGIDLAKGKYLIFMDSDDSWTGKESLALLYNLAEEFGADVVRGEYIAVDEQGEKIKTITKPKHGISRKILDSASFYEKAIAGENFSVLFLFRRDSISNLRFEETRRFQEDIEFNIRYFSKKRKCVYTNTVFYVYRKRQSSIVTTPRISNLEGSFTLCDVFNEYVERVTDTRLQQIYRYNSVMMYYWTLETISTDPYYVIRHKIFKELSLDKRQLQVCAWAKKDRVSRYPIHIYIKPQIGVILFRYINMIKRGILKQANKIKRTICR